MSDLISRKYLLRWLRDYQLENYAEVGHEKEYNFIENLIKGIENEPSVEPVRGEWIKRKWWEYSVCSNCNCEAEYQYNFCPACGCDMRGKKND